ncbi:response regulator [Mariprofundus sp. KV]|uniref:response regulator n=1 Tax=Mariprofundus sp. KV TaxID=2608715 RepID=UPI0015A3FEED|nr:response regulator [Mariprofundus sp. KV]NWF35772.1 response regulator [Mariprofundus sp. KV]
MAKILLVEDNAMNLDILSRHLQRRGFGFVTAGDGDRAVQLAHSEQPDLILMDMNLPVKDGWSAVREIKASAATRDIPLIALTAYSSENDREKALAAGCDEYQMKPFRAKDLFDKIETLLHA